MMTKQEMEKAMENGESVWGVYDKPIGILEIKANDIKKSNGDMGFLWGQNYYALFDKTFKTRAEAEHYLHHANVTRTETLPFLTWEEFLEQCSLTFYSQSHEWFTMYWDDIDGIVIESIDYAKRKTWDLTEANFYKAYDECVMLFKEEG